MTEQTKTKKKPGPKPRGGRSTVTIGARVPKYQRAFVERHFGSFGEFMKMAIESKMEEYLELGLIDDEAWEAPKKETPEEAYKKWQAEQAKH